MSTRRFARKGVQPPNAFYKPGIDEFSHPNPCVRILFSTSTLYIYETLLLIIHQIGHKDTTSLPDNADSLETSS
jgi:hypothetical protein